MVIVVLMNKEFILPFHCSFIVFALFSHLFFCSWCPAFRTLTLTGLMHSKSYFFWLSTWHNCIDGRTGATSKTLVPPIISLMSKSNLQPDQCHNLYILNWTLEVFQESNTNKTKTLREYAISHGTNLISLAPPKLLSAREENASTK